MRPAIEQVDRFRYRIPKHGAMRVDGVVFASERLLPSISEDQSLEQVVNVAALPGIVRASFAMPDIHSGYGFPIGGVAAFDPDTGGVVSPGGVGYDINCGVRMLRSDLLEDEVRPVMRDLVAALFAKIPCGVGSELRDKAIDDKGYERLMIEGANWVVRQGHGSEEDLDRIEKNGRIDGADPGEVSDRARERGRRQLGSLGSGNHFIEVQTVSEVFDAEAAQVLGLFPGQVTVTIHTGSRGFGHQVCDDFLRKMLDAARRHHIALADRQLACAPIRSKEGRSYLAAMACAANYAFGNRQRITALVRDVFEMVFRKGPLKLGLEVVYDVCHNIATLERHLVGGREKELCVHRKGATRAFPPGHPDVPEIYRSVGQPVLIPGDMGRCSYVLVGTKRAYDETFGSACHGAGRLMSRTAAAKSARGRSISREMENLGIVVKSAGARTLLEEIPDAYKDVSEVVDVVEGAGLGRRVVKLRPLGVIKG